MSETLWQKFHVGQRVWCVNDSTVLPHFNYTRWQYVGGLDGLTSGQIYTISDLYLSVDNTPCCTLVEIVRPQIEGAVYCDAGYALIRFKPLREQNIEIFRKMCREVDQKVRA